MVPLGHRLMVRKTALCHKGPVLVPFQKFAWFNYVKVCHQLRRHIVLAMKVSIVFLEKNLRMELCPTTGILRPDFLYNHAVKTDCWCDRGMTGWIDGKMYYSLSQKIFRNLRPSRTRFGLRYHAKGQTIWRMSHTVLISRQRGHVSLSGGILFCDKL